MKYLKLFENYKPSEQEVQEEITEFATPYLAYLFDLGFKMDVKYMPHLSKLGNAKSCEIVLQMKHDIDIVEILHGIEDGTIILDDGEFAELCDEMNKTPNLFSWEDISDHLIPFLQVMEEQYNLYPIIKFYFKSDTFEKEYDVDDLIQDDSIEINDIYYLRICFDIK